MEKGVSPLRGAFEIPGELIICIALRPDCRSPPDHRSRTEITTTGRERATPKYSRLIHWVVEGDLHRVGGGVVDIDNGSARSRFLVYW